MTIFSIKTLFDWAKARTRNRRRPCGGNVPKVRSSEEALEDIRGRMLWLRLNGYVISADMLALHAEWTRITALERLRDTLGQRAGGRSDIQKQIERCKNTIMVLEDRLGLFCDPRTGKVPRMARQQPAPRAGGLTA